MKKHWKFKISNSGIQIIRAVQSGLQSPSSRFLELLEIEIPLKVRGKEEGCRRDFL
jgi:hypothetical protein